MVWRALCDFHPSPLAAAATRRWQQTPKFGTWARGLGFSTTDFGTTRPAVSHMFSPATNGAHAKPGNSHLCANAQRPCRSFGHGLPRRAHNLQRWQKTRLCSSLHSSAVTLRYGAHRGNDSIAEDLTRQIADVMRIHDIVRPGDRVVICVSGGLDSVSLLHVLVDLREEWDLELHVLHFNHGKRAESEEEESYVQGLGTQLGVKVHVCHPHKPFRKANFQAEARAWRREEAQKLLGQLGAQIILQGHHADDQIETVLLKILRGCHLSNIGGMAHREGNFGRPLLSVSKGQLQQYLASRSVVWMEDASNDDSAFLRNRVRAELVPLLHELTNGSLEERLQTIVTQSANLRNWLDEQSSALVVESSAAAGGSGDSMDGIAVDKAIAGSDMEKNWDASSEKYLKNSELDLNTWDQLPAMVQEDQLYDYVLRSSGLHLRYRNLRRIWLQMQTDNLSWEWRLGSEWSLVRAGGRMWTQRKCLVESPACSASLAAGVMNEVISVGHGAHILHPRGWTVRAFWEGGRVKHSEQQVTHVDEGVVLANLPYNCTLHLRMRQPGDRFCPSSRTDGKLVRLKDWMRNGNFPLHARDRTPLVCLDGEVLAVYPNFLGKAVVPNETASECNGKSRLLRVIIDRVTL